MENNNKEQPVAWIEIKLDPEEIDISDWIKEDETLDPEKILTDIKKELIEKTKKTKKWQEKALQNTVPTN